MPADLGEKRATRTPKHYLVSFTVTDATGLCSETEVAYAVACAVDCGLAAREEQERFRAAGLAVTEVKAS